MIIIIIILLLAVLGVEPKIESPLPLTELDTPESVSLSMKSIQL
tara:strand:- start:583 stop:714 length:132 start_codon:yes stop_codon:yes gene_type:complete